MAPSPAQHLQQIAAITTRQWILIGAKGRRGGRKMHEADKVAALVDAAAVLTKTQVPYALIGGVAVGIHSGFPRATVDTDMAVLSTAQRSAVIDEFKTAGFTLVGEHPHSVNFRHASGEPVQLAFDAAFDPMIRRAEVLEVEGNRIRIVGKQDLIAMKRQAAADPARRKSKALRDQADVELLTGDVPDPDEGW
jgi:hypothetical protein